MTSHGGLQSKRFQRKALTVDDSLYDRSASISKELESWRFEGWSVVQALTVR